MEYEENRKSEKKKILEKLKFYKEKDYKVHIETKSKKFNLYYSGQIKDFFDDDVVIIYDSRTDKEHLVFLDEILVLSIYDEKKANSGSDKT